MGALEGKVALITGAARGQGRSHARTLAAAGADIIAIDICAQVDSVPYPMSTPDDLAERVTEVEALGRRIVAVRADVRDDEAMRKATDFGVAELGRLDIAVANAGIISSDSNRISRTQAFRDVLDVNLTGIFVTVEAARPHLIEGGRGGAIVLTSSLVGLRSLGAGHGYTESKHGVVGLMRPLAIELAPHFIRVNSVHPTTVNTPMIMNAHVPAVPTGPRDPEPGRRERPRHHEPDPDPLCRGSRHLRGDPVPGGRHRPLHHRRHAANRRRSAAEVGMAPGCLICRAVPSGLHDRTQSLVDQLDSHSQRVAVVVPEQRLAPTAVAHYLEQASPTVEPREITPEIVGPKPDVMNVRVRVEDPDRSRHRFDEFEVRGISRIDQAELYGDHGAISRSHGRGGFHHRSPPHPPQVCEVGLPVFETGHDDSHVVHVGRLRAQLFFQTRRLR
jgi:(+)-trans-carveol dehydrogenase